MRGSIFSFLFIFCATVMFAQKPKLNRANQSFKNLNYQEAIESYLAVLDKTDNSEAKRNIAECYRKLDNWVDAEYWYGQTVILPDVRPEDVLYYGMALLSNGKLSQAKEQFQKYISLRPDDLRGQLLLKACDQSVIDDIAKRGAVYKVANATKLNTALDDFGPSYFEDGVVFSSERDKGVAIKRQHGWSDRPFVELFYTKATLADQTTMEYNYSSPEKYSSKINSKFHDGPVSFNSDFSEIYFTRNNLVSGKVGTDNQDVVRLKVFSSKKNGKTWSDMQSLPFDSDEYSVAHPAISADGSKLYFASDMPGGFGGMDLYVSNLENGRWSPPQNLGPVINTEGHEIFPTLHKDGTLFFASDGHTGLGGLDIYYTQERGNGFTPVMNMGSPINSNVDDFHLIMNEEKTHGYFSSNREGGAGGDDIYTFTKFAVEGEVYVFDKATSEPIQGAVVNTGSCNLGNLTTGPDGKQKINLPVNSACEFLASKESFQDNTMQVSTRGYKPGDKVLIQIPLERPYNVKVTGVIRDEQTGRPIGNAKVILESDCGQAPQEFMTDNTGYYEFDLRANCCYVVKVQKEAYAPSKIDQFCTDKEPKAVVVNKVLKNETERPREPIEPREPKDPRIHTIQLEHIYYDFDKSNIRGEAVASLDELATYLKSNPSLIVEIGSHTDARATNKYNERLSARRAESVVRYLTQKGIGKNRLRAKGYGETAPVNDCFDNVKCDENQHQDNRRTEFRVIGSVNNQETEIRSTRPGNISVDPCKKCPF